MSDRFDHTLERKLETKPGEGDDDVVGVRRIELITGQVRRRGWSREEKTRILLESAEPGANISEVARRNGLSPQQLFGWRREARTVLAAASPTEPVSARKAARSGRGKAKLQASAPPAPRVQQFAPVMLVAPATAAPQSPPCPPISTSSGVIEIVIGTATVRVTGKVDARTLDAVLAALHRCAPPARRRPS